MTNEKTRNEEVAKQSERDIDIAQTVARLSDRQLAFLEGVVAAMTMWPAEKAG